MTGYNRKQLIVGIDPGTTKAYAILNLHGEIIVLSSSKKLKLDSMIKETTDRGTPLIVGTDRKKCPGIIRKYAAKTGAVKAIPDYDVSEIEKNVITKGSEAKNSHQKDALAAALVAYKQYQPLLNRVDKILKREGKEELEEEVKNVVITKKISILKSIKIVEKELPLVRSY